MQPRKNTTLPTDSHADVCPQLKTLDIAFDADTGALNYYLQGDPRPCFTPRVIDDIHALQIWIRENAASNTKPETTFPIRYLVAASADPDGLSLGGDIDFFIRAIRGGDRKALSQYAHQSIDVLYENLTCLRLPITTIALLRGTTLGASFESALSCDVIIAEEGVQIGFPEIAFNMFPGMGAYSLLSRRVNPAFVESMIISGKMHDVEELHALGVIDVIAKKGQAEKSLKDLIRRIDRKRITYRGVHQMRRQVNPVSYAELREIADLWVDSALSLTGRDLSAMAWLLRAQNRKLDIEDEDQSLSAAATA